MTSYQKSYLDRLNAWRAKSPEEQHAMIEAQHREPSFIEKAVNFAGAVATQAVADLTGNGGITAEVIAHREATCNACPHHDAPGNRCNLCGCNLGMKRAMSTQACPEGRWLAVPPGAHQ